MSQKIIDVVNSEGKNADQVKSEAQRDFENARNDYNDLANSSLQDSVKKQSGASKGVERRPATSIGAQGYNSGTNGYANNNSPRNSSLNKPDNGLKKDDDKLSDNKESAPDIGKDYGDSQVPQNDGDSVEPAVNSGSNTDNQVNRNVPGEARRQGKKDDTNQSDKNGEESDDKEKSDKKSNDLDEIDKKKKEQEQNNNQTSGNQGDNATKNKSGKNDETSNSQNNSNNGNDSTGNGYGALRRNNKNQVQPSDSTKNARRNLDHQNKVNSENSKSLSSGLKGGLSSKLGGNFMSGLKNKFKGGVKNIFNKANNEFSDGNNGTNSEHDNSFMGDLLNNAMASITSSPYFKIAAIIFILFILILLSLLSDGSLGKGKKTCTYNLSGLSSNGNVEIKNAKVELINCDGSEAGGYEVLDVIDFEKYVLGVTLAEAGPGHEYDDTYKAQIIAVRNFTLTRHLGMCPSNPDNCFFGYNAETNTFRMRACTNDQVYWDYTKDIYTELRDGKPSLYGPEAEANGTIWKTALSEEEIARYEGIAEEVMGEVLLDENGDVLKLGYKAPQTEKFISMPAEGYNYVEILNEVYGSSNIASSKCSYSGHFDYGDYTLTSDDDTVLNQSLESFLSSNGSSLEEFNELIASNVDDAGYGTRAGVVAAAVTLIGELGDNYGVKVPYYWGGGHADGVVVGALGYWGSTECRTSANGRVYDRCGLDCSGFVPWAIKNGGFNISQNLASNFQYLSGARRVSLSSGSAVVQPGDLLESDGHVVLVVAIDEESKEYICAEAAGYDYGVLFVRRSFGSSGYWGVDMEGYYTESNVRSKS
ncbi:MAG: hypothetical protein ACI4XM_02605 [Candidatus Coprovivens sp.]